MSFSVILRYFALIICWCLISSPSYAANAKKKGSRAPQKGLASWYGKNHHGKLTANGERFDMNQMTAAHKTLPMNSRVKVKSLTTGKTVVVRINDRGPYSKGRIIDLSFAAAKKLGMVQKGMDRVQVEVLKPSKKKIASKDGKSQQP